MLTIGKMSQACRVSLKTLRYYDRIGLLKPVLTDPDTGYRYYSSDQIDIMTTISRYKRFGFSLQEIIELMKDDPQTRGLLLQSQLNRLSSQIDDLRLALNDLTVLLERHQANMKGPAKMQNYTIEVKDTTKQPVYGMRKEMSIGDFGQSFGPLFEELAKKDIPVAGPLGARYFDEEFDSTNSDIEVFIPVGEASQANSSIGGTLCAMTRHQGGYSSLSEGYAALVKWIDENGYEIIGAPYELYIISGNQMVPVSEWLTDIYFPVQLKK